MHSIASFFISWDWIVFGSIALVWLVLYFLFKNQKDNVRKNASRRIAGKAAAAGDRYRNAERVEVDASEVPGLSQDELKSLTDEFVRLHFVGVLDFRLRPARESNLIGFGRTLVNRELFSFGEIIATQKSLDRKERLLFGFSTYLEDGWTVGSINRQPFKVDYHHRLPKNLTLVLPNTTPEQLLARHLELCNCLVKDLGLKVLTDLSLETRHRKIEAFLGQRRAALLRSDILAELPEALRVAAGNEWEWLGDYPREKARRAKGKSLLAIPASFPAYEVPQKDALQQLNESGGDTSEDESIE